MSLTEKNNIIQGHKCGGKNERQIKFGHREESHLEKGPKLMQFVQPNLNGLFTLLAQVSMVSLVSMQLLQTS